MNNDEKWNSSGGESDVKGESFIKKGEKSSRYINLPGLPVMSALPLHSKSKHLPNSIDISDESSNLVLQKKNKSEKIQGKIFLPFMLIVEQLI